MVIINAIGATIKYGVWSSATQIEVGNLDNLQEQHVELTDANFQNNDGFVTVYLGAATNTPQPGAIVTTVKPEDRDAIIRLLFTSPQ